MEDTTRSNGLSGMLAKMQEAHSGRMEWNARGDRGPDETLVRLRDTAAELYRAIQTACRLGKTVLIHSTTDSHQTHTVCTTGGLIGEVILRYSPAPNAASCTYHCVLTEADSIEVVSVPVYTSRQSISL
jgi:hypothetical protein